MRDAESGQTHYHSDEDLTRTSLGEISSNVKWRNSQARSILVHAFYNGCHRHPIATAMLLPLHYCHCHPTAATLLAGKAPRAQEAQGDLNHSAD